MASCVRNIRTKNYQNLLTGFQVTVDNVGDVFLGHNVDYRINRCVISLGNLASRRSCSQILYKSLIVYCLFVWQSDVQGATFMLLFPTASNSRWYRPSCRPSLSMTHPVYRWRDCCCCWAALFCGRRSVRREHALTHCVRLCFSYDTQLTEPTMNDFTIGLQGGSKKWHRLCIRVSFLVRCIIFAIFLFTHVYRFHQMTSFLVCRWKQVLFWVNM